MSLEECKSWSFSVCNFPVIWNFPTVGLKYLPHKPIFKCSWPVFSSFWSLTVGYQVPDPYKTKAKYVSDVCVLRADWWRLCSSGCLFCEGIQVEWRHRAFLIEVLVVSTGHDTWAVEKKILYVYQVLNTGHPPTSWLTGFLDCCIIVWAGLGVFDMWKNVGSYRNRIHKMQFNSVRFLLL